MNRYIVYQYKPAWPIGGTHYGAYRVASWMRYPLDYMPPTVTVYREVVAPNKKQALLGFKGVCANG